MKKQKRNAKRNASATSKLSSKENYHQKTLVKKTPWF